MSKHYGQTQTEGINHKIQKTESEMRLVYIDYEIKEWWTNTKKQVMVGRDEDMNIKQGV